MISLEVFFHFAGPDHLWLDIDNSLHYFLILSIDALSFALLGDIIERLGCTSLNLEVLLVSGTVLASRYKQQLVQ